MTATTPHDAVRYLEQTLTQAMRDLDQIKAMLGVGSAVAPVSVPVRQWDHDGFADQVDAALVEAFGTTGDFEGRSYENLYRHADGDADTVRYLISRLGARGARPESLASFIIGIVKKQGIATLRMERARFLDQHPEMRGPQAEPDPTPEDAGLVLMDSLSTKEEPTEPEPEIPVFTARKTFGVSSRRTEDLMSRMSASGE